MKNEIKNAILAVLPDAQVEVLTDDNTHFQAIVISQSFVGKPLIQQHKLVMQALKSHFDEDLHALALKTYTPQKWKEEQSYA